MRVRVRDTTLFFDVEGPKLVVDGPRMAERPTLVLLHGGPGFDHSVFKPAFSAFAERAQLVYLDHRGQGRSDRCPPEQQNLDTWADDVRAFCEALAIERPVVLGLSFGGIVALNYGVRHPDHPRQLVLASTSATLRLDRVREAFRRAGGPEAETVADAFWGDPNDKTFAEYLRVCMPLYTRTTPIAEALERTERNLELAFEWFKGEFRTFDLRPQLARLRCPTLLLAGEDDPITTVADAEDIRDSSPEGLVRLQRVADAGHGVFRDRPERFFELLTEFLDPPGGR